MALRLLHTADWHLGHALHGVERGAEHRLLLDWLLETAEREQVDALLVAGDVFDGANPPTGAQAAWYRFLVEGWRRLPRLQVVVVGGNHDSASKLDLSDPFLRALERLHVVGGARREGVPDLERLLVPLRDRAGQVAAWVAAIPFLRAADLGIGLLGDAGQATRRFYAEVLEAARARRQPHQALLAMGHLYLSGGQPSDGSERPLFVGDQAAVPQDAIPPDVAYAALGHLHLAQQVGERPGVRYAGSLLPLSLGERAYRHGVVIADLEGAELRSLRVVAAPRPVALPRVPEGGGAAPPDEVLAAIALLPARGSGPEELRPLLEVCVRLERPEPGLRQRVERALEGREARLVRLGVERAGAGEAAGDVEARPITELGPEEVFRLKVQLEYGSPPSDELLGAFRELHDQVLQEER